MFIIFSVNHGIDVNLPCVDHIVEAVRPQYSDLTPPGYILNDVVSSNN